MIPCLGTKPAEIAACHAAKSVRGLLNISRSGRACGASWAANLIGPLWLEGRWKQGVLRDALLRRRSEGVAR